MKPLASLAASWPAVSELLDEALALPETQRADWLDGLSGGREAYRETLQALLQHQSAVETDDFLGSLPALPPVQPNPHEALGPGGLVGPYRLVGELGRGGMATVWLAERADGMMSRQVALKLPHVTWGAHFVERMHRERQILASLEHEHIARLYDAGVDAQGRPYLAMEHVKGEPIDAWCEGRGLSVQQRVLLLLQVMAAVGHAHARLVVHRDLKPSNILVTDAGQVKLLDFGIAKLLEGGGGPSALTELSGRSLTPDYASPEQIRGQSIGTASDVYSLAVVAYELLAEAKPYRLKRGSAAELEEAVADAEPCLASEVARTPALRHALRGDIEAILNRGLKKELVDRYPNVESLAQDLQRYLRGEPVLARPDSRRYRTVKFVRRHRALVAMSAALALAVVSGAAVSLWQAQVARAQEGRTLAEYEGAAAVRQLYTETIMRLASLGIDDPQALTKPGAVTQALRQQLQEMRTQFQDRPRERDAQLYAVTLQLGYTEEFEAAIAVGRELLASLQAHGAPAHEVIEAYTLLGGNLFRLRRYEECEEARRAGLGWSPDTHDPITERDRQKIASGLGSILRVRGKREEAEVVFTRAEQSMARLMPTEPFRFENLKQLSMFWLGFDEAKTLQAAQQAYAGVMAGADAAADGVEQAARQLGYALQANGQLPDAETMARRAVQGFVPKFGLANRNTLRAIAAVGDAISRQGDYERSGAFIAQQRQALAALPGGLAPGSARTMREQELENAWLAGDVPSTLQLLHDDLPALITPSALADHDLASFWPLLALDVAGRPGEALAALLAYRSTVPVPDRPTLTWIRTLEIEATLELAMGRPSQARKTAQRLNELLAQIHATAGRAYRVGTELAALAAARSGDNTDAASQIALADAVTGARFPSRVERAESSLRRAEVLMMLGRQTDARMAGQSAIADLIHQHRDSRRLAAARRFAAINLPTG